MRAEELRDLPSLSCVENYYLGFFQSKLEVRKLYVNSFVPFQRVLEDFLVRGETYENCSLERLQATGERLGLTSRQSLPEYVFREGALTLIRVNSRFFGGSKRLPWRADHFIALEARGKDFYYCNNVPFADGTLSKAELDEVYDGVTLLFEEKDGFDAAEYGRLAARQREALREAQDFEIRWDLSEPVRLRDALLVLKILRKRLAAWTELELAERGRTASEEWKGALSLLNRLYETAIVTLEFLNLRKRSAPGPVREKLERLCEQEAAVQRLVMKELEEER